MPWSTLLVYPYIPVLTSPLGEDAAVIGACLIARNKGISRKSMCLSIDLCKSEQKVFNI